MTDNELFHAPITVHLAELRKRLIYIILFFTISAISCFYYSDQIFKILLRPLHIAMGNDIKISYFAPHEAFFTYMNLSLYSGLLISMPMLLIQIWGFVAPGLYQSEKKIFRPFLIATPLMFVTGMMVAYYIVLPTALHFFSNFQSNTADISIVQETRISDYSHFVLSFMMMFGLAFELPVLVVLLGVSGIISHENFRKWRSYVILLIAVFSAIATPPDMMSMILMMVPLCLLYEISIWVIYYIKKI